jgi:hypothetical protein
MDLKQFWRSEVATYQKEVSLRQEWSAAHMAGVEAALEDRLRISISENPGAQVIEVRDLSDAEFPYPERHKCRAFQAIGQFLRGDAKIEYDFLVRQGLDAVVLRKPVPGYRDARGFMFKFYLCATLPVSSQSS